MYTVTYRKPGTSRTEHKTLEHKQSALEFAQSRAIYHDEIAEVLKEQQLIIRYWYNEEFGLQYLEY